MTTLGSVRLLLVLVVYRVGALQNPYCSLSCDFGDGQNILHTVCERDNEKCGPGPACGPDFREIEMTDHLRQYIVDLHNRLRNNVASGNETRNNQPSAKKMMTLNYNRELEFIAQCWANTCNGNPLIHDICRGTKNSEHNGQNLGFINSTHDNIDIKKTVHKLIMYWYDEVAIFKSEWVPDTRDRGPNVKVGHYTQMIWGEVDSIGCAMSYYTTPNPNAGHEEEPTVIHRPEGDLIILPAIINEKWHHLVLVCNYSPGGNYLGSPIYDQGTPCSDCPSDQPCGKYSALCGRQVPVKSSLDSFAPFFRF